MPLRFAPHQVLEQRALRGRGGDLGRAQQLGHVGRALGRRAHGREAALTIEGKSCISRIYHLDRGYSRLEEKLGNCGAQLRRIKAS